MTGRSATIAVLGCYALLLALIALNNLTDPGSNWPFVQHVLAMDTTFRSPRLMWRAITDPTLQGIAYAAIIAAQCASAGFCVLGTVRMIRHRRSSGRAFQRARGAAVLGVTISLVLWLGGFLAIGAEWFVMWQSAEWNGTEAVGRYLVTGGIVLLLLLRRDA